MLLESAGQSVSDRTLQGLAVGNAFGGLVIRDRHRAGPASSDSNAERYVFVASDGDGPAHYAVDVERRGEAAPSNLENFLAVTDDEMFFRSWTALEVLAKLTAVPAHQLLLRFKGQGARLSSCRTVRWDRSEIMLSRCDTDELWIAVGCLTDGGRQ